MKSNMERNAPTATAPRSQLQRAADREYPFNDPASPNITNKLGLRVPPPLNP
jgi:hypothetical protein